MFSKKSNATMRVTFVRDVAGSGFFAQAGDVMELPAPEARAFIKAGTAEPSTNPTQTTDPSLKNTLRDPREARRQFAERRHSEI